MIDLDIIKNLRKNGLLNEIDIHFADFIAGSSAAKDPDVFLAAALVSHATGTGDICFDLEKAAGHQLSGTKDFKKPIECPDLDAWLEKLIANPSVGRPGQFRPLILDEKNRLYLYRYWDYERFLSKSIQNRVQSPVVGLDFNLLRSTLDRLFSRPDSRGLNWQKVAAAVACFNHFSVITGGPGTGKTFTVTKVLALLLEQAPGRKLEIYLAAPTGKAATRLKETVERAKHQMNCDDSIKAAIPSEVFTIHRLLGPITGSPYFRQNRKNQLMADAVVVDEASMVDLALMAKLFEAVPENARLILIGDKDQLASVEAGSVLGDICDRNVMHGFSTPIKHQIKAVTGEDLEEHVQTTDAGSGLQDAIVVLRKSYRFATGSGIGDLSRAVNRADPDAVFQLLSDDNDKSIIWQDLKADESLFENLSHQIVSGYQSYLKAADPAEALQRLQRFKILCALNVGPLGVQAINRLAEQVLRKQNLIPSDPGTENPWYAGRPVLITRNHYPLGLFNGDIGVTLPDAEAGDGQLAVYFTGDRGEVRRFPSYQLPEHTTVYAMTVHKSQGSEFDELLFILPDSDFSILTRERTSGLRDALWESKDG